MTASTAYMMAIHRPQLERPWHCTVCGCDHHEPCAVLVHQATAGRPATKPAARYEQTVIRGHCYPVGDVCSRCHNYTRPNTKQRNELARIRERVGEPTVRWSNPDHTLEIMIEGRPNPVIVYP